MYIYIYIIHGSYGYKSAVFFTKHSPAKVTDSRGSREERTTEAFAIFAFGTRIPYLPTHWMLAGCWSGGVQKTGVLLVYMLLCFQIYL